MPIEREGTMPRTSFKLTPELDVADLDRALAFYVDVIGFQVLFDRPEERFAFGITGSSPRGTSWV